MYEYIAMLAYVVVLFLTLRDIRIYMRTGFLSYRKGVIKGIIASTIVLVGIFVTYINMSFGLLLVLIALFINQKGPRERVFEDANTMDRLLGKTDIQ